MLIKTEKKSRVVTQNNLIKMVSQREGIPFSTAKEVLKGFEEALFETLHSVTPREHLTVKLLDGVRMECEFTKKTEMHTFCDTVREPKRWVKTKISRHYNRKLNDYFTKN